MFKPCLLSLVLTLQFFALPSFADIYQGFREVGKSQDTINQFSTKGNSAEGLRNTLLSQLLIGPTGEEIVVKFRAKHPLHHIFEDVQKDIIENFERVCRFNLKRQSSLEGTGKAHLVFVIPGFGANKDEGAASYLSELIHREGMVTLSTHSPAHPDFIEYSSALGFPGSQRFEGFDLYQCLQYGVKKLEQDYNYDFDKISVVGASLGSMNAFRLAMIDLENQDRDKEHFGFYRVFSLNPPISNVYGSTAIDTFVGISMPDLSHFNFSQRLGAYISALTDFVPHYRGDHGFDDVAAKSQAARTAMASKGNFTAEQLQFLVGFGFAPTVFDAVEAGVRRFKREDPNYSNTNEVIANGGRLAVKFFTGFHKNITFNNWRSYGFIVPHTTRYNDLYVFDDSQGAHLDGKRIESFVMTEQESIGHNLPKLQEMVAKSDKGIDLSHYHLVTWDDDFLLRTATTQDGMDYYQQDDVEWILNTLPGRTMDDPKNTSPKGNSHVFTNGGGHLGGYWQDGFKDYLRKNLQ